MDASRRPLYLYDLPAEIFLSLTPKDGADVPIPIPIPILNDASKSTVNSLVGAQACSLCGLTFSTVQDQRAHLKSDLHNYNLKQKLKGHKPVTESEFEKLIGDLDESLSGSDSDDNEEDDEDGARKDTTLTALLKRQATLADKRPPLAAADDDEDDETSKRKRIRGASPILWFASSQLPPNTYYGIYKAIFTFKELERPSEILDAIKKRQLEPIAAPKPNKDAAAVPAAYKGPHIFLCMIGGGHFAAMVVSLSPRQTKTPGQTGPLNREATVLAHKTFHRYTTRRKQGGAQSTNDNSRATAASSAGSSLRRYNEQALVEDVRALLRDWRGLLDSADLLFVRATGVTNRRTLFGPYEGQVLKADDPRLRNFPFSTRRATQSELMRAFIELTRLKVCEILPIDESTAETVATSTLQKTTKPAKPKLTEEEETATLHTTQLQAMIRRSKLPALLGYFKSNNLSPDFAFFPPDRNHHAPTSLHLAASQSAAPLVTGLLVRGGADPTIANANGQVPFEVAGDRATRDAFRVARSELGEDRWDWEAAKVPAGISRAEAEARTERERADEKQKEAERRRAEEERLKTEGPKVVTQGAGRGLLSSMPGKTAQEKREDEVRGLTPEMRVRLERERRARAAEERLRRMQAGG